MKVYIVMERYKDIHEPVADETIRAIHENEWTAKADADVRTLERRNSKLSYYIDEWDVLP